jgi:hypothetical protein
MIEAASARDKKGRRTSGYYIVVAITSDMLYLLATPKSTQKGMAKMQDRIRDFLATLAPPAIDTLALAAEREKLVARVAEIDSLLGGAVL